jgi:hypothetical protein
MTHQRKDESRADYLQRSKDIYRAKHPVKIIALWHKVEHMTPQERADFFQVEQGVIVHNALWIQTRDSFHAGKEWRRFSQAIRAGVTVCPICNRVISQETKSYITGNTGKICFHTHHKNGYELDKRVIEHGFLYDLKDKSKFAVICTDCHYTEHKDLIAYEDKIAQAERIKKVFVEADRNKVVHGDYDGLSVRQIHIKSIARVKAKNTDIMEVK